MDSRQTRWTQVAKTTFIVGGVLFVCAVCCLFVGFEWAFANKRVNLPEALITLGILTSIGAVPLLLLSQGFSLAIWFKFKRVVVWLWGPLAILPVALAVAALVSLILG